MKICKFDSNKRCWHSSCSLFDCASGSVLVCPLHPHPSGFFMRKKVVGSHLCIFDVKRSARAMEKVISE